MKPLLGIEAQLTRAYSGGDWASKRNGLSGSTRAKDETKTMKDSSIQNRKARASGLRPVLLITALLALAGTVLFGADLAAKKLKAPKINQPGATAHGKSLAEWLGIYWRWNLSGADPAQSRVGKVQLLPIPAGEQISGTGTPDDPAVLHGRIEMTLPAGTPFVLSLFAWIVERYDGYPAVSDDLAIDNDALLAGVSPHLTIDGRTVVTDANEAGFYIPPTPFDPIVVYPTPSSYGSVAALFFQGVGFVSAPLTPGVHEIHLYEPYIIEEGVYPPIPSGFGTIYDYTWIITVKP
jgi:hypothetical protein